MKDNYKISVIVPVYNVEKYLRSCINSLLNQSFREIEIILVNDGSTDNSGEICKEYEKNHSNITLINKDNGGLGSARNAGIKRSKANYIGFVDSDDIVSKYMFEKLFDLLNKNNADCAFCESVRFWDYIEEIQTSEENIQQSIYHEDEILVPYLIDRIGLDPGEKKDCSYGASVCVGLFNKKIIIENDIEFVSERELISEDMIFDIDYIRNCRKIVHTNEILYYYRFNPESLTTNYDSNRFEKNIYLSKEMMRRLENNINNEKLKLRLSRYFLTFTRVSLIEEVRHMKSVGATNTKNNIKRIMDNEDLILVLDQYPLKKLPKKQFLFFSIVKLKLVRLCILFIKLNFFMNNFQKEKQHA